MLVEEKDFASDKLTHDVVELLENSEKRLELQKNIAKFAKPDANKVIYDEIKSVMANKSKK